MNDTWTRTHDLALIFIALAYGTDSELADAEIVSVKNAVRIWRPDANEEEIQEIVVEAVAIFLSGDAEEEVARSIQSLRGSLSVEQRRKALTSAVEIATADGIILDSEQSLITVLSDIWEIQPTRDVLLAGTDTLREEGPKWSLLHDIALMYVSVASSIEGGLTAEVLTTMLKQIHQWEPDIAPLEVHAVLKDALHFFADAPSSDDIMDSATAILDRMTRAQRSDILTDLSGYITPGTESSGNQNEMVERLAQLWKVDIRLENMEL